MKQKKIIIVIVLVVLLTFFASSVYAYYYCPQCMTNTCVGACSNEDTGWEYQDFHYYYVGEVFTQCEIMRAEYFTDGHCEFCPEVVKGVDTHIHSTWHEKCGGSGNVCPYN